ncbi:MAG: ABC transporter ATP-binding protein, partial [Acidimicrobiales bacterium]
MKAPATAIEVEGVSRRYDAAGAAPPVEALVDVDLAIARGELVAITGPSGSGKSTLLHMIGALDRPTEGEVRLDGRQLTGLSLTELARVRNRLVGFVFQSSNLVAGLTTAQNVALPAVLGRVRAAEYRGRARELLDLVGLPDKADRRPSELSGGEQQRVAVARALIMDPPIVLADEPTGNLDTHTGDEVMQLLHASHDAGRTVVIVTHDLRLASQAERIVRLRDGRVSGEVRPTRRRDRPLRHVLRV